MKIIIFGANGQTGKCLVPLLTEHELLTPSSKQVDFSKPGDLRDFIIQCQADYVINLAAYTAVDKAESEVALCTAVNSVAVKELVAACKDQNTRLLHVSTDFVFDGSSSSPIHTDTACAPLGVYGETKYQGEKAIQDIYPDRSIILRTAWVYSDHGANFMLSMLRLMKERTELNIVTDQIGTPTSAYSLANVIRYFINTDINGVFHWTDSGIASWYDFAIAIYEEASDRGLVPQGVKVNPIPSSSYPTPAKRPAFSVLDKSKTYAAIDVDKVHWRQELRNVMDFLR